jgi:hypothetical protein
MKRILFLLILIVPSFASAATIGADKNVTLTVAPPDNTYLAGSAVRVDAHVPADLSVVAGTMTLASPVDGDFLGIAGSITSTAPVAGDVRMLAGNAIVNGTTGGDLVLFGGKAVLSGSARDILVGALSIDAEGTSTGPVRLYGADITLNGNYAGDVTVVATDRFTVGPQAHIGGTLRYNAPQQVTIPGTASVAGPVTYIGSYRYVPTNQEAQTFALFGIGLFFIVRALSAMIVAGLLVGMFPLFAHMVVQRATTGTVRRTVLSVLLGGVLLLFTPVVVLLLLATFAGAGLAFLLGALYAVFIFLSFVYAGVIVGAMLRAYLFSRIRGNFVFTWQDALLGALALYFIQTLPIFGIIISLVIVLLAAGSLAHIAYRFAFTK